MDKKQMQQSALLIPLLLLGGGFSYYQYLQAPLMQKSQSLQAELDQIKSEYQLSQNRVARLPKMQQEIADLQLEIDAIEKRLPVQQDVPNLIRLLSQKMEDHGIVWQRLAPGTQTVKDYYIEHVYNIPFVCRYHDLAAFLSQTAQMERIFSSQISNLSVVDGQGDATLQGELQFLIYTSK